MSATVIRFKLRRLSGVHSGDPSDCAVFYVWTPGGLVKSINITP